jgi:hypothetical protein
MIANVKNYVQGINDYHLGFVSAGVCYGLVFVVIAKQNQIL